MTLQKYMLFCCMVSTLLYSSYPDELLVGQVGMSENLKNMLADILKKYEINQYDRTLYQKVFLQNKFEITSDTLLDKMLKNVTMTEQDKALFLSGRKMILLQMYPSGKFLRLKCQKSQSEAHKGLWLEMFFSAL